VQLGGDVLHIFTRSGCASRHQIMRVVEHTTPGLLVWLSWGTVWLQQPLTKFPQRIHAPNLLLSQRQLHNVKVLQHAVVFITCTGLDNGSSARLPD
jgi:hypothetical protein